MIIGLTSANYGRIPINRILGLMRWAGVSFSEVTTHILRHPLKSINASRTMRLGLHLPNWGNCGYDFSTRQAAGQIETDLQRLNAFASRFQFTYAVFHPPEKDTSDEAWNFLLDNLRRVPVPLVMENMRGWSPQRFVDRLDQCRQTLGSALSGVCLDIPHSHLSGQQWQDFYDAIGDEIRVIHLSDCSHDQDLHLPFHMDGVLSLETILRDLKERSYDRIINFELKPPSPRHLSTYFQTLLTATDILDVPSSQPDTRRINWLGKAGLLLDRLWIG